MFKKHINASNSRQLGGKDAKKFKADLAKHYPSLSEEQTALLLPPKTVITLTKLSNRSIVYGRDDGVPLFFDPTGHGDKLIPTIYALSLIPTLVPTIYTLSEVSSKVLGGADLFLQGVLLPTDATKQLDPFLAGSVRSISIPGNPIPFAVGTMAVSSTEAAREGMKGRGLTLMHSYGDLLWALGPKNYPPPNPGFTLGKILPIEINNNSTGDVGNTTSSITDINTTIGGSDSTSAGTPASGAGVDNTTSATSCTGPGNGTETENGSSFSINTAAEELESLNIDEAKEEEGKTAPSNSIDIDPLLEAAVLGGLKSVTNAELPLQFGDFYQKHMLPLRPEGITFDFKASKKYKKLSKLLDYFEKEKVLAQKQIRKQDHIFSVDRTHRLLVEWKGMPPVSLPRESGASTATSAAGHQTGAAANSISNAARSSATAPGQKDRVQVEYLYKPPTSLRPLFLNTPSTCSSEKERLFSEEQVSDALTTYATAQNLIVATPGIPTKNASTSITLDAFLASSLWGKKEGPEAGSQISQPLLLQRLLTKLQQWHRILRPALGENTTPGAPLPVVEVVRKGPVRPLSLLAEKRRGRNVTAIAHVETFGWTAEEIQADYQRRFKTACSISKLPGKQESDYEILMQGDLLVKVEKYLKEVEGIDGRFILINNKLSGKKK